MNAKTLTDFQKPYNFVLYTYLCLISLLKIYLLTVWPYFQLDGSFEKVIISFICKAYQGKHNGSTLLTNEQCTEQLE